jgi:hypothetical protein
MHDGLCNAFTAPRTTSCVLPMDLKTEMGRNIDDSNLGWRHGIVVNRQQVCGRLVVVLPDYFFGAADDALCDVSSALTGLFDLNICPPCGPFPGSQVFSRRYAPTPASALIRASLRRRVDFTSALALVAALQVCSCPFVVARKLEPAISQRRLHVALEFAFAFTCRRDLDSVLALSWRCLCQSAFFAVAPLDCARPSAAAPQAAARVRAYLLMATSQFCASPRLAHRALTPRT